MTQIALISLARRGGMIHFHAELFNALTEITPVVAIVSRDAAVSHYPHETRLLSVDLGKGALGTFFNAINPFAWWKLSRTLKKSNADVFHIVASHEWNPLLAFFIKLMRKPFVFTIHDPEHHLGTPVYMKISDAITASMADLIIVLSRLGREQLIKKGYAPNMIRQIPIGVYSFFSRHVSEPKAQEKMILFFGRIEPYKGLSILLKAFCQVSDSLPDWKLVIAGNGDMSEYASLADHAQVEVINRYVGDEEVVGLMQRAMFVVLPYTEATQSGVIPIAYAFARTVIATDVGSLGETVQDGGTGFLIQPNNVDKLAQAILTLTGDIALCSRMGQAAYEFAHAELAWEKIAQMYLTVYSEALQHR